MFFQGTFQETMIQLFLAQPMAVNVALREKNHIQMPGGN